MISLENEDQWERLSLLLGMPTNFHPGRAVFKNPFPILTLNLFM